MTSTENGCLHPSELRLSADCLFTNYSFTPSNSIILQYLRYRYNMSEGVEIITEQPQGFHAASDATGNATEKNPALVSFAAVIKDVTQRSL